MMSSSRPREASSESFRTGSAVMEKRRATIFSIFSSSRKSTGSRSSVTTDSSVENSPTQKYFPHNTKGNRKSSGSQISASHLQIPFLEEPRRPHSNIALSTSSTSPHRSHPSSPSDYSRHRSHHRITASPTSAPSFPFPPMDTQAKVSPTTRPSQKFLSQMPLSLALKTATIATPLPVVKTTAQDGAPPSKVRNFFFGSKDKPNATGPTTYEFEGRSTYALVHGSILRYRSAFGDDLKTSAIPDSTHFLNTSSIVYVTDAVPGFKWVLEIKTWFKVTGIKSPIKKSKSAKNLKDRNLDLRTAPWGVVDGLQAWYLIFETPNLMTEWMTLVRAAIADIKEREARGEKSPKTPKVLKTPIKSPSKPPTYIRSPRISSPTSSVTESLPSSPSSSKKSFLTTGRSNRSSLLIENNSSEEKIAGSPSNLDAGVALRRRSRQPSQQDIALTAFRISAYEDDLASFVPPVPETTPDIRIAPETPTEHYHPPTLTPNLSHYAQKRTSIISLQSRLSSLSSGPRSPNITSLSPTSSPRPTSSRRRRTLRRTHSGESSKTNGSWKYLQSLPPPHPPPTGPLPLPPLPTYTHTGYGGDLFTKRDSLIYDQRESMILGISPVFETDTPKSFMDVTPRSSPHKENSANISNLNGLENTMCTVKVA